MVKKPKLKNIETRGVHKFTDEKPEVDENGKKKKKPKVVKEQTLTALRNIKMEEFLKLEKEGKTKKIFYEPSESDDPDKIVTADPNQVCFALQDKKPEYDSDSES